MIDVSDYQGGIDWRKVRARGHLRAYVKATEGTGYRDPSLDYNAAHARRAGVQVGFYHYGHPSNSPRVEAAHFLRTVAPLLRQGDLRPALDLEVSEGHSWEQVNAWKAEWLAIVDHHIGALAVFYSYWAFWKQMRLYTNRPVWGAYIGRLAPEPASWAFRQWSFTGSCPGIHGHVDLDTPLWKESRIPTIT